MKTTLLLAAALIGIGFWGRVSDVSTKPSKPAASYDTSLIHFKPNPEKATKRTRAKGFDF
jgi:hypothetical protein